MDLRALGVAVLAVVALTGIALAADTQLETFLKPEEVTVGFNERSAVQGNLVALTGFLVAGAFTGIGALLTRIPVKRRILPLTTLFLSTYLLVLFVQTAMFNYVAIDIARSATFTVSPILYNGVANPGVYIGPMAIVTAAAIGVGAAGARLLGRPDTIRTPKQALVAYVGAVTLAVPFLIILIWATLMLLLGLPETGPHVMPYMMALPILMLAALVLLVGAGIKTWQLGQAVRDGPRGLVAHDAWIGVQRAEWVAAGTILLLAMLGTALAATPMDSLEAGRVFGLSLRGFMQASALVLITLVPAFTMQTPTLRILRHEDTLTRVHEEPGQRLLIASVSVLGVAFLGAGLATWLIPGSLWAWVFAALPGAVFALVALRPTDSLIPALTAGLLFWAIGNSVSGSFELVSLSRIQYETRPGLLALWRACAVLLVAWAVARAARARTGDMSRTLAWPLTTGMGACIALIIFLELPFSAWVIIDRGIEYVGIGTVVASQDPPVQAVIHFLAGLASFALGWAVARLHRPDWFVKAAPLPSLQAEGHD